MSLKDEIATSRTPRNDGTGFLVERIPPLGCVARNDKIGIARTIIFLFFALLPYSYFSAEAAPNINFTKHNLSASGPGPIKATGSADPLNRICIFCHTPHHAYMLSEIYGGPSSGALTAPEEYSYLPLWYHKVTTAPITGVYASGTLQAAPLSPPVGATKLCLSCHDGTVAVGAVASGANLGIQGTLKTLTESGIGSPTSVLGTDLSTHHPVSFPYSASSGDPYIAPVGSLPSEIHLEGGDTVHCTSCHDPHDDTYGNFLVMDNNSSQLCKACHTLTQWENPAHNNCASCHTPHFAVPPGEWLLNFSSYDACLVAGCHDSQPIPHTQSLAVKSKSMQSAVQATETTAPLRAVGADIKSRIGKVSGHHAPPSARILSQRNQLMVRRSGSNLLTCMACHNPHKLNKSKASAPYVSGMLRGVSGVTRNGIDVDSASYEYEVCFKCHSDYTYDYQYIPTPRVINTTNLRLAFDPGNQSYHPVVGLGKNISVPSIPSAYVPDLRASDIIYCTDCHRDDEGGSRGPHGSSFAPILGERYESADGTPETYENYALCYRCHNRASILNDDSFKKNQNGKGGHSGHLAIGAPCSVCHDPHGVSISSSTDTGSHTHLINFDTRTVLPKPGGNNPFFTDTGIFSGSCALVCHGRLHDNESYPQSGAAIPAIQRRPSPFLPKKIGPR